MKTIRISQNIYGNYGGFVGVEKVRDFGQKWDAMEWFANMVATKQYKVSSKSLFTEDQATYYINKYVS